MVRLTIIASLLCTAVLAKQIDHDRFLGDLANTKTQNEGDRLNKVANSFDLLEKVKLPPGPKSKTMMKFLGELKKNMDPVTNDAMNSWYELLSSIALRISEVIQADSSVRCSIEKFNVIKEAVAYLIKHGTKCANVPLGSISTLTQVGQMATRDILEELLYSLEEIQACYDGKNANCAGNTAFQLLDIAQRFFENIRGVFSNTVNMLAGPSLETVTCLRNVLEGFSDALQITDEFKSMCVAKT